MKKKKIHWSFSFLKFESLIRKKSRLVFGNNRICPGDVKAKHGDFYL